LINKSGLIETFFQVFFLLILKASDIDCLFVLFHGMITIWNVYLFVYLLILLVRQLPWLLFVLFLKMP